MELEQRVYELSKGFQQMHVLVSKHQAILEYHQKKAEQLLRMEKRIEALEHAVKGLGWF